MPPEPVPRVLAALRPRMLELARERAAGAHPYFVPVAHTARARALLGDGPLLAPEQTVVLDSNPDRARTTARGFVRRYLQLPNYVNNLRDLGYGDEDFADGGSDRLVDAIVAWGDEDAIAARVRAHHDVGADHVAIQPLAPDIATAVADLTTLAPVLIPR
jgi:probable F420-dependent oxidoreductase